MCWKADRGREAIAEGTWSDTVTKAQMYGSSIGALQLLHVVELEHGIHDC